MKIGTVEIKPHNTTTETINAILWGPPACGKTVFAATAPGRKLWLLFDPNGLASLGKRDDIEVADLTGLSPSSYADFREGGIYEKDIAAAIKQSNVDTVVVDSLTSFAHAALVYVVQSGRASGKGGGFQATVEQPGEAGYGLRNAFVFSFFNMLMRVCQQQRKHLIVILHEKDKYKGDTLVGIVPSLGGANEQNIPLKVSEIWHMRDVGHGRAIYVRSFGTWYPMRTRIFALGPKDYCFMSDYDQYKETGVTIAQIYQAWQSAGFNKIDGNAAGIKFRERP